MAPSNLKTRDAYTVAIICAMDLERNAVRYMLDEEHPRLPSQPGDSNSYTLGNLNGHDVVLACLPSQQGKGAAATVATNMSRSFPSIKWRLFVGIGGGVPSDKHDVRLGDVVISMPEGEYPGVVQYDLKRETTSGFELKGFLWPLPALLRNAAQDMRSDHIGRDNKIEEYTEAMFKRWPRMISYKEPMEPDVLFEADLSHPPGVPVCTGDCDRSRAVVRPARQFKGPAIHYGLVASGDSVIKNAATRDELARRFAGDVLCFEMEAAGLMTEYPSIVIRGISDYADSHKNSAWQHYAAATAAACAKELLSYVDPGMAAEAAESAEAPEAGSTPKPEASAGNAFKGQGILNTGSVTIGRDFSIRK